MFYDEFVERYKHEKLSKDEVAKVIGDFNEWKMYEFSAQWKKEYFEKGCHNCGSNKLVHYDPKYEGRDDEWAICPTIWKVECKDCGNVHEVVTNDDNDILDEW